MANRCCLMLRPMFAVVAAAVAVGLPGSASAGQLQFNLQAVVPLACNVTGTRLAAPNILEVDAMCNADRFAIAVGDGLDGRRITAVDVTNDASATFRNETISVVATRPGQYRMSITFAAPIGAQAAIPVSLLR